MANRYRLQIYIYEILAFALIYYTSSSPIKCSLIEYNLYILETRKLQKLAVKHDDVFKWKHFRVTGHLCGEFTDHRSISRTEASDAEFDAFFDLRLNKRLSKQWWCWWFETPSRPLWRHCYELCTSCAHGKGRENTSKHGTNKNGTRRRDPRYTWRNSNVVITSKRHFDVITSKWRRFD